MNTLYLCDPEKHTTCSKKNCFINGGPCNRTHSLAFAKQPLTKVTMVFDMTEEEAKSFTGEGAGKGGKQKANPRFGKKSKNKTGRS